MDTHFFFYPGTDNVITVSQAAIRVDEKFGDNEYRDAFSSGGITFDAGQNRMDDIFAKVVFTVGDKNFIARLRASEVIMSQVLRLNSL